MILKKYSNKNVIKKRKIKRNCQRRKKKDNCRQTNGEKFYKLKQEKRKFTEKSKEKLCTKNCVCWLVKCLKKNMENLFNNKYLLNIS